MKLLVDMNLPPCWTETLRQSGWDAVHWQEIGNLRATDSEIMAWAKQNGYVVFTHDLDFGTLLTLTQAEGPSVVQVRTQDVTAGGDRQTGRQCTSPISIRNGKRGIDHSRWGSFSNEDFAIGNLIA
jgi:predicted nuclease of predicted toxin-antitoxin system